MQSITEEKNPRGNRRLLRPLRAQQINGLEEVEHDEQQQPQQQAQQVMELHRRLEEEHDLESWKDLHCQRSDGSLDDFQLQIQGGSAASNGSLLALTLAGAGIDFCSENEAFPFQHLSADETTEAGGWQVVCCDVPQQSETLNDLLPLLETSAPTLTPTIAPTIGRTIATQAPTHKYDPSSPDQIDFFPYVVGQCFVSSVAAFFSLATILAMTLPLLKRRRRKRASTYNLYLVFLAIPDLMYNLFLVYLFSTYNTVFEELDEFGNIRKYKWVAVLHLGEVPWMDHPFDLALFATCAAANLYMNAIIALEILKLLRNSKRRKRSKAPTLTKACIQALCTYTIGALIFVADYFNDNLKDILPTWLITLIYLPIAILIPIIILLWVCFRIYWEGLIGDTRTKAGKRLTILIRYFTRIIVVYICIWLPAVIFYTAQFYDEVKEGLYYFIACTLYAMSAWANFGLSLTKPDVRKNFYDLFTGKVCIPEPREPEQKKFTFSGNSEDKQGKGTTSTGEEDMGDKPPAECVDIEEGCAEPEQKPINVKIKGIDGVKKQEISSASEGSNDTNIFEFGGADAPRMRLPSQKSNWSIFVPGMMTRFSALKRYSVTSAGGSGRSTDDMKPSRRSSAFSVRSHKAVRSGSVQESSELRRGSVSEPFQIHSTPFRDMIRRGNRDGSDNSKISIDGLVEPNKPPSAVIEEEGEESTSNSEHDHFEIANDLRSSNTTTGTVSFFMDKGSSRAPSASSKMSFTTAFFMDGSSTSRSTISSPKAHKQWMTEMRKNIQDMARLLKMPGVSEDKKTVFQQSIQLKRRALQSIILSSVPFDSERGPSGASITIDGVDVSAGSELSPDSYHDADLDSDIFGVGEGGADETRFSKVRWLSELRNNIRDLSLRLEQEDLGEEEREIISRAIESQKVTLASIECIGEDVGESVLSNNPRNVDHSNTSAFVTSTLEVINDESESVLEER